MYDNLYQAECALIAYLAGIEPPQGVVEKIAMRMLFREETAEQSFNHHYIGE